MSSGALVGSLPAGAASPAPETEIIDKGKLKTSQDDKGRHICWRRQTTRGASPVCYVPVADEHDMPGTVPSHRQARDPQCPLEGGGSRKHKRDGGRGGEGI